MKTLILCLVILLSVPGHGQTAYSLAWSSIDGGGSSPSAGGALALAGATIGQPEAAPSAAVPAAGFAFHGGVWHSGAGVDSGVIASDDFSYPDGPASDTQGGTGAWDVRWIGFGFRVEDGAVNGASTMPVNFNRLNRSFVNAEASPELYFAVDLTTPAAIGLDDFAVGTLFTIEFSNPPSVVIGKVPGSNELVLGNNHASSGITLQPLTAYRLIGGYDIDQRRWLLWVNPDADDSYTPDTGEGTADATLAVNGAIPAAYQIRLESSKPGYIFDNLVISHAPGGVGLSRRTVPPPLPEDLEPEVRLDHAEIILSWKDLGVPVVVEESDDLLRWAPVVPQPTGNSHRLPVSPGGKFLRLSLPGR